jgi:hypothetical protein
MPHCVCSAKMRPFALVRSRTRCIRRRSRSRSARSSSEGSHSAGTSSRRESSASRRACQPHETARPEPKAHRSSSPRRPSPQRPVRARAEGARPDQQGSDPRSRPTRPPRVRTTAPSDTPNRLRHTSARASFPLGFRHRRVSLARRPFFMTLHKRSTRGPRSRVRLVPEAAPFSVVQLIAFAALAVGMVDGGRTGERLLEWPALAAVAASGAAGVTLELCGADAWSLAPSMGILSRRGSSGRAGGAARGRRGSRARRSCRSGP